MSQNRMDYTRSLHSLVMTGGMDYTRSAEASLVMTEGKIRLSSPA